MAHTRPLSDRHGLPLLALIFIGVGPFFASAQNPVEEAAGSEAAPIVIDMAAPLEPERAAPSPAEPDTLGIYRRYITSMEESSGAFAPGLTEQLLGLGLNLQALNRHAEAATVLKRGVHVSRIQSGLYAADQIPLLKAEIRSLSALGRYDEVDEHQRYLARVESEALEGTPASIAALLDQGAWAEQAWDLGVGDQEAHPEHLARSWEYYRLAYNQSTQLFGDRSLALLKPLEGMLRLQYRFAALQRQNANNSAFDGSSYRQTSALGGAYRRGEAVLSTILGIKSLNGSSAGEQAYDLTRLGDWGRWMGRRSDAQSYYDKAWRRITPPPPEIAESGAGVGDAQPAPEDEAAVANDGPGETPPAAVTNAQNEREAMTAEASAMPAELAADGNAEDSSSITQIEAPPPEDDPVMRAALFETATPLPDIDTLRPLPPFRRDASGSLVVQFQLNEAGKITLLERITVTAVSENTEAETSEEADDTVEPEVNNDPAIDRLLRKMRRTRFRPRYEEGKAVETGMIVWSFDLNPAGTDAMALQP
ncbi:MAG: hypothetical protein ACR2PN_08945 [Luminiphilus sp.]